MQSSIEPCEGRKFKWCFNIGSGKGWGFINKDAYELYDYWTLNFENARRYRKANNQYLRENVREVIYMVQKNINLNDNIFRFIYITAMRDAVGQKAYDGNKKWTERNDIYQSLKNIIEPLVKNVLNNIYLSSEEYDAELLKVIIHVCDYMNIQKECNKFTFGNSQKLVNMIMKYFYITCYDDDNNKSNFRYCHCPVDSIMLQRVWSKCRDRDKEKTNRKRDWFLQSWSKEEFDTGVNGNRKYPERYNAFQQAVRYFSGDKKISPIEFDFEEWN